MGTRATPKPSAAIALAIVGAASSTWLALMPAPRRLHASDAPPIAQAGHTLDALWLAGARALPALEQGMRFEAWGLLGCVLTCVAATFFAQQLFRGPGRQVAAVSAGLVCAVALGAWVQHVPPRTVFPELPFTILALLALTAVIRPLVQFGRLTPVAIVRGLAAASGAAVLIPGAGLPLLSLVAATCVLRARARRDLPAWLAAPLRGRLEPNATKPDPTPAISTPSMTSRGVLAGNPVVLAGVGLSPLLLLGPAAWWGMSGAEFRAWFNGLALGLPPLDQLSNYLPPPVSFPAMALLILLVAPLRWRGGLTIVTFAGLSLVFRHGADPLTPWPTLIALTSVAAAGWVWLAGTVVHGRAAGLGLSIAAASLLGGLFAWWSPPLPGSGSVVPLAELRPAQRLDRFVERGLIAPGDVLLVHDAAIVDAFARARAHEGLRPDVQLVDASDFDDDELRLETFAWVAEGRRVLSDSFSVGGRWRAEWAMESGPLYWFVFDVERTADQDLVLLPALEAPTDPNLADYAARARLERARYRRAIARPTAALQALEPWTRGEEEWITAVRTAEALRLPADVQSELPMPAQLPSSEQLRRDGAPLVDAEVGDLLYHLGDHPTGTRLLLRAGERGYLPAYGALVRWELRAGETGVARQHLRQMADDPALHAELAKLLAWIARNETPRSALELRQRLRPNPGTGVIEELAARLGVLEALARPPAPGTPAPAPDTGAADEAAARREEADG